MTELLLLSVLPLLAVLAALVPGSGRRLPAWTAALFLAQVPAAVWICWPVLAAARPVRVSGNLGLDGVGAAFVVLTSVIAAAAMGHAALQPPEEDHDLRARVYHGLVGLFLVAMYAVQLAHNIGLLWIAMETTTLMSAPLIYHHRSRDSLEATWKYLILCSVGIAFALFGTILIFAASQRAGGEGTLLLGRLMAVGPDLDLRLLRLGFIFCLLGYGTKAGLFPLHNWLPDAHSEAPAPISALLSGALLNCALVALWRISRVVAAAGHQGLVQHMLVPVAAISVLAAGMMLFQQHDLKRMWAYSSVEHMGLLTLAIGLGAGPLFLLHAWNHSLVKAALFLLSGNVLHLYGSKALSRLRGLLELAPGWGVLLGLAGFAIAGSPPFGTFLSEWLLLRDAVGAREYWAVGLVLAGLTATFLAVSFHVCAVAFGAPPAAAAGAVPAGRVLVPGLLLAASVVSGLALTPPVLLLLARLAGGGAP